MGRVMYFSFLPSTSWNSRSLRSMSYLRKSRCFAFSRSLSPARFSYLNKLGCTLLITGLICVLGSQPVRRL